MTPAQANFDGIARPYRWLEYLTLGPLLQRCRTHFLGDLRDRRRALILGDGDGRFTAKLLQSNPEIHVLAVDTSAVMLDLLRTRCRNARLRLETVQQSAFEYAPRAATDLIVSHFFLDCLSQSEVDTLIPQLTRYTAPDTLWLVSDFRIPANGLRLPAQFFVRMLYFAFRVLTGLRTTRLPDYAGPLASAGFRRVAEHRSLGGLLATELWQRI